MRALIALFVGLGAALAAGACNDVGTCPAAASVVNGQSCSGDNLECPYTLETLNAACDGTMVEGGIATSCLCTKGAWSCPLPVVCVGGAGDDGGGEDSGNSGDAPTEAAGGG